MRKRMLSVLLAFCMLTTMLPMYAEAAITYGEWSDWWDAPISPSDTVDVETRQVVDVQGHTEYRYGRWVGETVNWCKEYGESLHGGTYSIEETAWSTERAVNTGTYWVCGHFDWEHPSHVHTSGTDSRGYPRWTKYQVSDYGNPDFFWEESRWVDNTYKTQYRQRTITRSFTVSFNANGGTETPGSMTVINGKSYGTLPTLRRDSYSFDGWYTSARGGTHIESSTTVNLNGDQTLYAHWTLKEYKVTFSANGGTVNLESKKVTNGGTYGQLPTPEWANHRFDGWYTSAGGGTHIESSTTVNLSGDQTLYAHWTYIPPSYNVIFDVQGGYVSPASKKVTNGEPYGPLPSPTRDGHSFDGWYTGGGTRIYSSTIVDLSEDLRLYAHWTPIPESYTVTFDANEGYVSPDSKKVTNGESYGQLPAPRRDNYGFDGWYTRLSGGERIYAYTIVNLSGNQTLYARWTYIPPRYTVTLDANEGSVSPDTLTVSSGEAYGELPIPVRDGYRFDGWYTSPVGGTRIYNYTTVSLSGNQTLYAHWSHVPQSYTVFFDPKGGSVSPEKITVANEGSYGELPTPVRDGFRFDGWFTAPDGGEPIYSYTIVNLSGNQTLYAHWTEIPRTYTVTLDAVGGSVSPRNLTVTNGQPYGQLPVPVLEEHRFDGWHTSSGGGTQITGDTIVDLSDNQTLYAHWTYVPASYSVTFDANGGTVAPESITVTKGQPYGELPKPERNGYAFTGWFTEKNGGDRIESSSVANLNGNQTLYAHWTPHVITAPTVTTNPATNVTKYSASLSGTVNHDGGDSNLTRQFIYWDKYDSASRYTINADANFHASVSNLSPSSTYYYYAKAINSVNEGSGSVLSFTTEEEDEPQSIEVSPTFLTLRMGESYQLLASVFPETASNRNIIWTSSNKNVASVDRNGRITAAKKGSAIITAETEVNRLTASCSVNVTETAIGGAFDFSEWNMVTNTSSYAENGFDWDTARGGNYLWATAYLARWDGAVLEEHDAYPPSNGNSQSLYNEVDADYHVQEVIWIPERSGPEDNDELKAAVIKYGALYASFEVKDDCFDEGRKNYYLPRDEAGSERHAVAVVGWDDNYSASNFNRTPPGNGAFICKNSWGVDSGEDGYFYVSYFDKTFARSSMCAAVPSIERNTNYNVIYQYDPLGPCAYLETGYAANVFPPNGSSLSANETLRAVSFYTYDKNTSYEVYVVKNYQDSASLAQKGASVASGVICDIGYHTVLLNSDVELAAGSRFAVIVKLSVENGSGKTYYEYPGQYTGKARANPDESYYSANGTDWKDLTSRTENANFCIKAFTDNGAALQSGQLFHAIDNDRRDYVSEKVYSLDEILAAGIPVSERFVEWSRENERKGASLLDAESGLVLGEIPAMIDAGSNAVSFINCAILPPGYDLRREGCVTGVRHQGGWGSCWAHAMYASLESCLMKKAKTVSVSDMPNASSPMDAIALAGQYGVSAFSLKLNEEAVVMAAGSIFRLNAVFQPAHTTKTAVIWSSNNVEVAAVDTNGTISAHKTGSAVITATTADGALSAKCAVLVNAGESVRNVAFRQSSISKAVGEAFMADYTVNPAEASNKQVTWVSDNPEIVSVNENGRMEALSVGTAVVTVTTADGGFSDTLTVHVTDGLDFAFKDMIPDLKAYGANLFGSVKVELENRTDTDEAVTLCIALFNERGKMANLYFQEETLHAGDNTIVCNNLAFENAVGSEKKIKCFALNGETWAPVANFIEKSVT